MLSGVTNVPFLFGMRYRRATVGTQARAFVSFQGDPGGNENFEILVDDATPTEWKTFWSSATPTRSAHISVYVFIAAGAINNNCEFAEVYGIKGVDQPPPGYLLTAAGAAEALVAQITTLDNSTGKYYDSGKGSFEHRFHASPAATTKTLRVARTIFAAVTGGSLYGYRLFMDPTLKLRVWDASGVLIADLDSGIVPGPGDHTVYVDFNPGAALLSTSRVVLILDGKVVAHGATVAWTPYDKTALPTVYYASTP
jgi:hypothetical protein